MTRLRKKNVLYYFQEKLLSEGEEHEEKALENYGFDCPFSSAFKHFSRH